MTKLQGGLKGEASPFNTPPLLSLLPIEQSIAIEPVADKLSLRPGLVKIAIAKNQGDEVIKYYVPIQWSSHEAAKVIHDIRGISWQLDEDGRPINYAAIAEICQNFCNFGGEL